MIRAIKAVAMGVLVLAVSVAVSAVLLVWPATVLVGAFGIEWGLASLATASWLQALLAVLLLALVTGIAKR